MNFVEWKQYNHKYEIGDIVFIYTSAPESRIAYMLVVEKVNIPLSEGFDDSIFCVPDSKTAYQGYKGYTGKLVRFKLLKKLDSPALSLESLLQNGLKSAPQGLKYLDGDLLNYIICHIN